MKKEWKSAGGWPGPAVDAVLLVPCDRRPKHRRQREVELIIGKSNEEKRHKRKRGREKKVVFVDAFDVCISEFVRLGRWKQSTTTTIIWFKKWPSFIDAPSFLQDKANKLIETATRGSRMLQLVSGREREKGVRKIKRERERVHLKYRTRVTTAVVEIWQWSHFRQTGSTVRRDT